MIRHICVNIDHLLTYTNIKLGEFFQMPGDEVRAELLERKADGEKLIGSEKCEGFDPVTGCPGHPDKPMEICQ